MMPKTEDKKTALVCKYSSICDLNCEKCKWLKNLEIIDLSNIVVPTFEERGCDCG